MLSASFTNWVTGLESANIVRVPAPIKPMSLTARFQSAGYTVKRAESLLEFFAARSSK